ncbi:MAG: DUF4276 family protein [Gammaproteobacteria bacterium]|nr:DUF4276 family protein [Gammaproteobacteria bacterium]
MTDVIVACEGRTEQAFINEVVQPALAPNAVFLNARLISTSSGAKGGALSRDRVVGDLCRVLRQRDDTYVTTFFDLYGLPADFPGKQSSSALRDPVAYCEQIEASLRSVVTDLAQRRSDRFVPHIQPYEFEALLLADTTAFGRVNPKWQSAESKLASIVAATDSPEHVNDGINTHPSARIRQHLPGYRKVGHGVDVAAAIGLERIRTKCGHFAHWLGRMEALPPLARTDT